MRVTYFEPYPAPEGERALGGPRYRDEALVNLLRSRGHQVQAFTSTLGASYVRTDSFGGPWEFLTLERPDREPTPHVSKWLNTRMADAVAASEPDVLLVRAAGTSTAVEVHRRCRVPSVVILGGVSRTTSILEHDLLLTETAAQEAYFRIRVGQKRLLRLPKLPAAEFLEQEVIPVAERSIDVIVVANFTDHKNHRALVPLFDHPYHIVLLGDGPLRSDLEGAAARGRAGVEFAGSVPPREVARRVGDSKVLVHPSRSEGFPRAIAEAMSVATPAVGMRDVIGPPVHHDHNGALTTPATITDDVVGLLEDLPRLERYSEGAHATFQAEFSPDRLREASLAVEERMTSLLERGQIERQSDRFVRGARRRYWAAESAGRRSWRQLLQRQTLGKGTE